MNQKPKPTFWQERAFWISALLFIISLLQMFIRSPLSDRKMERYARYGLKGLHLVVRLLEDEEQLISIKPPKK